MWPWIPGVVYHFHYHLGNECTYADRLTSRALELHFHRNCVSYYFLRSLHHESARNPHIHTRQTLEHPSQISQSWALLSSLPGQWWANHTPIPGGSTRGFVEFYTNQLISDSDCWCFLVDNAPHRKLRTIEVQLWYICYDVNQFRPVMKLRPPRYTLFFLRTYFMKISRLKFAKF